MLMMIAVVVLLVACFGILLNVYVLCRLYKFAMKEPMRFENGCGLPLLVMTVFDMLALIGVIIFGFCGSVIIAQQYESSYLQNVLCKVSTFVSIGVTGVQGQLSGDLGQGWG